MKRCLFLWLLVSVAFILSAQERRYSTFYHQRASLFEELSISSKDIVFLGNSITNGGEWCELFSNRNVKNRGISGDVCYGVYDRLASVLKGRPAKIFLLIGINDLNQGIAPDSIVHRIGLITAKIKRDSPKTELYLQSVLPVTDHFRMFGGHTRHWNVIRDVNDGIKRVAEREQVYYMDLYTHFADSVGKMKIEYTNDGLHLMGKGYVKWVEIIRPYVNRK